jgi:hypothetical protein
MQQTQTPKPANKKALTFLAAVFALILLGAVVNSFVSSGKPQKPVNDVRQAEAAQAEQAQAKAQEIESGAYIVSQYAVKDQLKSPSTAEFPLLAESVNNYAEGYYLVKSYVDSQNSFGATVRNKYTVVMQYLGGDPLANENWKADKLSIQQ